MSDMPERIWTWLERGQNQITKDLPFALSKIQDSHRLTEYIHIDKYKELEAEAAIASDYREGAKLRIKELEELPKALAQMLIEKGIVRPEVGLSLVDLLVALDTALIDKIPELKE